MTFTWGGLLHLVIWGPKPMEMPLSENTAVFAGEGQRTENTAENSQWLEVPQMESDPGIATHNALARTSHMTPKRAMRECRGAWTTVSKANCLFHGIRRAVPYLWLLSSVDNVFSFSIQQAFIKPQLCDQDRARK